MFNLPKTEAEATALWDSVKPLYEQLKPKSDEETKLEEVLTRIKTKFNIGDRVCIKHTCYIGIIHSFNEKLGGFYPGVRYPIHVKIIETQDNEWKRAIGNVFEYGEEQVFHHKERYYRINAGHAAVDNGSVYPMDKLFKIAELADQQVMTGERYGDDYLHVPLCKKQRQAIEQLFNEEKLFFEIVERLPSYVLEKDYNMP